MSIFIPNLQQLEILVPELLQVKSTKHCLILLKTATLRWIIIRSLYDSDCDLKVEFEQEWFKVAQWQKQFSQKLSTGTNLTVDELLFAEYTDIIKQQFIKKLQNKYYLNQAAIDQFLTELPWQINDKTIRNNFTAISQIKDNLVDKQGQGNYRLKKRESILEILGLNQRASEQQSLINSDNSYGLLDFLTSELSTIAELLLVKINEQQRLFIHNDYVVAEELREPAADLADRLKQIWKQKPVPPIQIDYHSASLNKQGNYLVYPVCLYYYQRAYYLCAFGQAPPSPNKNQVQWYNYRLERITKISQLSWNEPNLPCAWGPMVEVLLPLDLRQRVRQDLENTWQFYKLL